MSIHLLLFCCSAVQIGMENERTQAWFEYALWDKDGWSSTLCHHQQNHLRGFSWWDAHMISLGALCWCAEKYTVVGLLMDKRNNAIRTQVWNRNISVTLWPQHSPVSLLLQKITRGETGELLDYVSQIDPTWPHLMDELPRQLTETMKLIRVDLPPLFSSKTEQQEAPPSSFLPGRKCQWHRNTTEICHFNLLSLEKSQLRVWSCVCTGHIDSFVIDWEFS